MNAEKLGLLYIIDHNKIIQPLRKTVLQFLEIKHIVSYNPKLLAYNQENPQRERKSIKAKAEKKDSIIIG